MIEFSKSILLLTNSTSMITDSQIKIISLYQSLVSTYPNLIDTRTTQQISKLSENQINLVTEGNADPNPNLLKLLDFSLELTQFIILIIFLNLYIY